MFIFSVLHRHVFRFQTTRSVLNLRFEHLSFGFSIFQLSVKLQAQFFQYPVLMLCHIYSHIWYTAYLIVFWLGHLPQKMHSYVKFSEFCLMIFKNEHIPSRLLIISFIVYVQCASILFYFIYRKTFTVCWRRYKCCYTGLLKITYFA